MPAPERDDAAIHITLMGHAEARNVDELWAGKTNVKERRRLQNRLNRRAYSKIHSGVYVSMRLIPFSFPGKRQVQQKLLQQQEMAKDGIQPSMSKRSRGVLPGIHVFSLEQPGIRDLTGAIPLNALVVASESSRSSSPIPPGKPMCTPLRPVESWCRKFEETMLPSSGLELSPVRRGDSSHKDSDPVIFEEGLIRSLDLRTHIPSPEDRLLNLMYYNVFRGLSKNMRALNLDIDAMVSWSYPSPFVAGDMDTSSLAPDFQPTLLQQTVPHHPCFDIFPDPVVRDNAIRYWYVEHNPLEGRLCIALAGRHTWHEIDLPLRHGCVLWGEADVVESWEVTEGFANDWPFLVKGALRLEAATNWYRALRGEPPISFA